jgi:hypothetical protein
LFLEVLPKIVHSVSMANKHPENMKKEEEKDHGSDEEGLDGDHQSAPPPPHHLPFLFYFIYS